MSKEAEFYLHVADARSELSKAISKDDYEQAYLLMVRIVHLAKSWEIENFPSIIVKSPSDYSDQDVFSNSVIPKETFEKDCRNARIQIEEYLIRVEVENFDYFDTVRRRNIVSLDEPWRQKITTHISHIRAALQNNDIDKLLYLSIIGKLNDLQESVDRYEARIDTARELFLDMTRAVAEGAKNLGPAVVIVKRLFLSAEKLKKIKAEPQKLKLPSPETLGLPNPSDEPVKDEAQKLPTVAK